MKYKTIISELNDLFPDFATDPDLNRLTEDLPGVHLALFVSYAHEHWNSNSFQNHLAQFMNALNLSDDEDSQIILSDFILDFYCHFTEHGTNIDNFLSKLSNETLKRFKFVVKYWNDANENIKRNSR